MGCSTSTASVVEATKLDITPTSMENRSKVMMSVSHGNTTSGKKYPASEAFIIPLDESANIASYKIEGNSNTIHNIGKKPPKRIQQMMDKSSPEQTLEDIKDKLIKAELRRLEYLQKKV